MIKRPKIPMTPNILPQQRIQEVVSLPELPAGVAVSNDGPFPKGSVPEKPSSTSIYLCQVEWSWSPRNNRTSAYYLHRGRSHWSLWERWPDDNLGNEGVWEVKACCEKKNVPEKVAAIQLLIARWELEANYYDVDYLSKNI